MLPRHARPDAGALCGSAQFIEIDGCGIDQLFGIDDVADTHVVVAIKALEGSQKDALLGGGHPE